MKGKRMKVRDAKVRCLEEQIGIKLGLDSGK